MKKVISSVILICLSLAIFSQPYRFLTPIKVSGYIGMDTQASLPTNPGFMALVPQGGKLWLSTTSGWQQLWPAAAAIDTVDNLYINNMLKFVGGGYIVRSGSTAIQIHPNNSPTEYITIVQNSGSTGTTISTIDAITFNSLSGILNDPLQGFRDDSTTQSDEDKVALSARATRELIMASTGSGGIGGSVSKDQVAIGDGAGGLISNDQFIKTDTLLFVSTSGVGGSASIQIGQVPSWSLNLTTTGGLYNRGATVNHYGTSRVSSYVNNIVKQVIWSDSTVIKNRLKLYGAFQLAKYANLNDTVPLVMFPGGIADTATFAWTASKRWNTPLEDFDMFYAKSEKLKALPLTLPNGKDKRRPSKHPGEMAYQFEYTLETLIMYLKESRDEIKALKGRINDLENQQQKGRIRKMRQSSN